MRTSRSLVSRPTFLCMCFDVILDAFNAARESTEAPVHLLFCSTLMFHILHAPSHEEQKYAGVVLWDYHWTGTLSATACVGFTHLCVCVGGGWCIQAEAIWPKLAFLHWQRMDKKLGFEFDTCFVSMANHSENTGLKLFSFPLSKNAEPAKCSWDAQL